MTSEAIETALLEVDHFAAFARQVISYAARIGRGSVAPADAQAMKRASIVVAKALAEMRKSS